MRGLILAVALLTFPIATSAQLVPARSQGQRERPDPSDTIPVPQFRERPPVSPAIAALSSLALPGWGQSITRRAGTGGVFVFWEGLTVFMTMKSRHQLRYLESISADAELVDSKRQEMQDWAVLIGFNHLMAAAEAFVSAQLWDFPATMDVRELPDGATGVGMRVALPAVGR